MKALQSQSKAIITKEELQDLAKLKFFGGKQVSALILKILRINKMNKLNSAYDGKTGLEYVNYAIDTLKVKIEVDEESLTNIPKEGPFVTVSNHPYGGLDGIAIFKIFLPHHPEYKTLSSFFLQRLHHLNGHFYSVNPFGGKKAARESVQGMMQAFKHLKNGNPLGLFPAGEVSSYNKDYPGISDIAWNTSLMKMIKKAEVPVVPVYFEGTNSRLFHFLGRIHPLLRTVKIPSEILNKKHKKIRIMIGKAIDVNTQNQYKDIKEYTEFLREKTYELEEIRKVSERTMEDMYKDKDSTSIENIAPPVSSASLKKEIERISDKCVCSLGPYELYYTENKNIPNLMYEIGRQREIAFRNVGEGINKALDLDKYDLYYNHLILWDSENNRLAGSYRLGEGDKIMKKIGKEGFYTSTLFKFSNQMDDILSQSLELGRSFIVADYQKKVMPLYMLWAQIINMAHERPDCKYMIGPVSISNDVSKEDKDRIVRYINKKHSNPEFKGLLEARNPYHVSKNMDSDKTKGLNDLELPVLFRKYLDINGDILDFNIDPLFNNSLDGFLLIDKNKIPQDFLDRIARFSQPKKKEQKQKRVKLPYAAAM